MTGHALDFIKCDLTSNGIPSQAQAGQVYTNTYTCHNTYPVSSRFPPIQLAMSVGGVDLPKVSITGSCQTQPLASGQTCQFQLSIQVTQTSMIVPEIAVGSLYYLQLPSITVNVAKASATISWPGFNIGSATVNGTGTGSGFYLPNAVDSSGQKITYTFSLSGPGTVIGNQNGGFTLQNIPVNNPGTITITATAPDAAPVVGKAIEIRVSNIPEKILAIYNNTNEVLYPIIETPILDVVDNWMQAQFQVPAPEVATRLFQNNRLHRTYPTPNGLQPGQSVIVSIPFYMQAVASPQQPTGTQPDDFIDNFNAMRVYLYDVQANFLDNAYNRDLPHQDTLYSPGIRCISGCTGELPTYNSGLPPTVNAIPAQDPTQLLEYTFGDAVRQMDGSWSINLTRVDYDVSAVDQVYLPIAMEPYNNPQIGYTGTTMDLSQFRSTLANFALNQPWPTYVGTPPYTNPRVPGAYNVIIGNQSLTPPTQALVAQQFLDYWSDCIRTTTPPPLHTYNAICLPINDLFQKNYQNYQAQCNDPTPLTPLNLMQHIYGWVPFLCGANPNELADTPGIVDYETIQKSYIKILQPSPPVPVVVGGNTVQLAFNPYVGLIHSPSQLNMNIYAFSIDDGVGNMNEIGDGVIVTVGGSQGLPNGNQFDPKAQITVIPGPPAAPNTNYFSVFNVSCPSLNYNGSLMIGQSFKFQPSSYPCLVTLTDNAHGSPYTFSITGAPPFPANTNGVISGFINCNQSTQSAWCNTINVNEQSIPTQPPNP